MAPFDILLIDQHAVPDGDMAATLRELRAPGSAEAVIFNGVREPAAALRAYVGGVLGEGSALS